MCGILGIIGQERPENTDEALSSITHRGPDDFGIWTSDHVTLGHRRLAVIDIEEGRQPMSTPDNRYHIVYNGEIYNFKELKHELATEGIQFKTNSDTEVLLLGYQAWGTDILNRVDGMFAFAIWDDLEKSLIAARDRFGIKPFYYSVHNGFYFASTTKPLTYFSQIPKRLNYEALRDYFSTNYIPSPMTIYRDIFALPPAHFCVYKMESKGFQKHQYWDIPPPNPRPEDENVLIESMDQVFAKSIKRQLVSDVPIGAFLSGGIDSSLMVAYMRKAETSTIRTFSIGFNVKDPKFNESEFAQKVAKKFDTDHIVFAAEDIDGETMRSIVADLDQPMADPALLPTYLLSKHSAEHVTVAISGDGGDELFGGYERFLKDWHWFSNKNLPMRDLIQKLSISHLIPEGMFSKTLTPDERVCWSRLRFGNYPVSRKALNKIVENDYIDRLNTAETMIGWRNQVCRWSGRFDTDSLMRGDLWSYLSDNCLVKTDRASMLNSLEVRVPILGNPVVDQILPYHASVKLKYGMKWILKRLCQKYNLPRDVWDRPKHGFTVPLQAYFRRMWHEICQPLVIEVKTLAPFLKKCYIQKLWEQTLNRGRDVRLTWAVVVLLLWLTNNKIAFD